MNNKNITFSSIFISLGILIPIIFHQINLSGKIFLPMHLPIFCAGLLIGSKQGFIVGCITPIFSSILTGMPPFFPISLMMMFELSAYGYFSGYIYIKRKKNIYISILSSMLIGRLIAGLFLWILIYLFRYPYNISVFQFIKMSILVALPGIIFQLIFIPVFVKILKNNLNNLY